MLKLMSITVPQITVTEFLKSGAYDHHLRKIKKILYNQVNVVREIISDYFPKETKVTSPSGGFILWVELPKKINTAHLLKKTLENNISIAPGMIFSAKKDYQNCFRLSCGLALSDKVKDAIKTIGSICRSEL
jgi:DNA-binding transcriptional MocR family regulator